MDEERAIIKTVFPNFFASKFMEYFTPSSLSLLPFKANKMISWVSIMRRKIMGEIIEEIQTKEIYFMNISLFIFKNSPAGRNACWNEIIEMENRREMMIAIFAVCQNFSRLQFIFDRPCIVI